MFNQVTARIAGRCRRVEPRASARAYLLGLLSGVERKNCWQLVEQAGFARPGSMQRLLRYACWDADAVRDDLRSYAAEHLAAVDGVLIVEETGFLKKGRASAGVQRQYTGTAGRIENAQVGAFLALATSRGRVLLDRRLYLPEHSWCSDPERRAAAGIPQTAQFATKPRLASEMITAALDAGITASWVTGDEAYGQDPQLRTVLEARGVGYVMAVACSMRVRINHGRTAVRADTVAGRLPATAWHRQSAGSGAKGPRHYDWAWIHIGTGGHRHLLIRRSRSTGELAFYLSWSPTEVPLSALVRVAGIRWSVEECFQAAKGQVGLDRYQVRNWTSWHRHITLAMLALAFLTALAADAAPEPPADAHHLARSHDPIAFTVPEIRRLFGALLNPLAMSAARLLHWSNWRRRHQATARRSHYRRRTVNESTGYITKSHWSARACIECQPPAWSRCFRVLTGQERMQQREQGARPVQRDDVAAVFDDMSGEIVGDRAELVFQRSTDRPGAQRHRWHRQAGSGDRLLDLYRALGQGPVVRERAAQRLAAGVCADEGVPEDGAHPVAERAGAQKPVDVGGLVAIQHGLGKAGPGGVEAEPPRRPVGEEVLGAGQPAQKGLHDDQAPDETGAAQGEEEGRRGARVDAHHRDRGHAERGEKRRGVLGQGVRVVPGGGPAARAEPAQVRRDDAVAAGQIGHDVRPQLPGMREAVQQQYSRARSGEGDVQFDTVGGDASQLGHGGAPGVVSDGD